MRRRIDPGQGQLISAQMTGALYGTEIAALKGSDGLFRIVDHAGNSEMSRGIISLVDGWLRVHLVDSFYDNKREPGTEIYRDIPVFANQPMGAVFDIIDVDNSTAALFLATVVDGIARTNMVVAL